MLKKLLKIIGLISFVLSYVFLIKNFIENGIHVEFTQLLSIAWIFGIISVLSNCVYAIFIDIDQWLFYVFGVSGLIWLCPLMIDYDFGLLGFPSLICYLIIGIYIHLKKDTTTVDSN